MKFTLEGVGERAAALIDRDTRTLSPSYTREYPLVVSCAEGSEVWDVDGKRYIDFMAGIAVLNAGHRHPKIMAAVCEQQQNFCQI